MKNKLEIIHTHEYFKLYGQWIEFEIHRICGNIKWNRYWALSMEKLVIQATVINNAALDAIALVSNLSNYIF